MSVLTPVFAGEWLVFMTGYAVYMAYILLIGRPLY